jgi:hypothetical protein
MIIYKSFTINWKNQMSTEIKPSLQELWQKYGTDKATLHFWYLLFYEEIMKPMRVDSLLEIGVYKWESMRMRRDYFPGAWIWGIDINPPLDIPGCDISQWDASKMVFVKDIYDIIIDDGSHMMSEQKRTFTNLRWRVAPEWIYIIEDLHTSFWPKYIDETPTTYDRIREFAKKNNIRYLEFWKDEEKHISGTIVLFKK